MDSPGHRNLIPRVAAACAQADIALLVLDVGEPWGETGERGGGETPEGKATGSQLRELVFLLRMSGIGHVVVGVNKMDSVGLGESEEKYRIAREGVEQCLSRVGYGPSEVAMVPVSALQGHNLLSNQKNYAWYHDRSLVDTLSSIVPKQRPVGFPFRMPVLDAYRVPNQKGVILRGILVSGQVRAGDEILIAPDQLRLTCRSVRANGEEIQATAGEMTEIIVHCEEEQVTSGMVVHTPERALRISSTIEARMILSPLANKALLMGSQALLLMHHWSSEVTVLRCLSQLDKKTGRVIKPFPKCLRAEQCGVVLLRATRPVCGEVFTEHKSCLSRITLVDNNTVLAAGVILSFHEDS